MEYNNKTQPTKQNSQNQTNQPTKPSEKIPHNDARFNVGCLLQWTYFISKNIFPVYFHCYSLFLFWVSFPSPELSIFILSGLFPKDFFFVITSI